MTIVESHYWNCYPSINISQIDLVDAFFQCFKDANEKGYEHILILEDDFIFDEKILETYHTKSIETFLKSNEGDNYIYYLGTLPAIQLSTITDHDRVLSSCGMHSCIYPKAFIRYILTKQSEIKDYDNFMNLNFLDFPRFKYNKILCYQIFPFTENQSNWGESIIEKKIIVPIMLLVIKYLNLNNDIQPGYNILNILSKIIFWIILVTFVLMTFINNYFIWKNFKWLKKKWHYFIYIFLGQTMLYPIFILFIYFFLIVIFRIYHIGFS